MQSARVTKPVVGRVVADPVRNLHGQVIIAAGTQLDAHHLSILRAWGISDVPALEEPAAAASAAPAPSSQAAVAGPSDFWAGHDLQHPFLAELRRVADRLASPPAVQTALPDRASVAAQPPPTRDSRAPVKPISADAVVGRAGELASLPATYFQVDQAINHPSNSISDIAAALYHDQALTARLLRIGNSAFYGFPRRVQGIAEAVQIIGTRQLHDLMLATVVLTQFQGVSPNLVDMASFWRHSLACGLAARSIAAIRREANTERFFVAGLLHDIGSLLLYQQLPERSYAALEDHRQSSRSLQESERRFIGCDHAAVGGALMSKWKLPDYYRDVACGHHVLGSRWVAPGIAVIHIADLLVLALNLGSNGEQRLPFFGTEAWDALGLPPAIVEQVADEVVGLFADAERVFLGKHSP